MAWDEKCVHEFEMIKKGGYEGGKYAPEAVVWRCVKAGGCGEQFDDLWKRGWEIGRAVGRGVAVPPVP